MIVSNYMKPAAQVVSCYPTDTIEKALEITLDNTDLGAVVVLHPTGDKHIPVGIVTKTDLLAAFKQGLSPQEKVQGIMSRTIETIPDTASREKAEEHFEQTKHHHAFVVNQDEQWVGLLTVWDVALEAAKDDRAWPWNRESVSLIMKRGQRSPKTQRKVAEAPKNPSQVHTFLDIAGANE